MAVYRPAAPAPTTATWVSAPCTDRYGTGQMPDAPVFLDHPASLHHDTGRHPEQAARMVAIESELSRRGWLGYDRVRSPQVARSALEAVHPGPYVDAIERAAAS